MTRRVRIGRIRNTVVERKKCGQSRVLKVGEQKIWNHCPARPIRTARPGLNDVPPEEQCRGEKTEVLELVPPRRTQAPVRKDRENAKGGCSVRRAPSTTTGCISRWRKLFSNGQRRNGPSAVAYERRGRPHNNGSCGAPRSSSGGATIVSSSAAPYEPSAGNEAKASKGEASDR